MKEVTELEASKQEDGANIEAIDKERLACFEALQMFSTSNFIFLLLFKTVLF